MIDDSITDPEMPSDVGVEYAVLRLERDRSHAHKQRDQSA